MPDPNGPLSAEEAERILRAFGGYEWLLDSGQKLWTVKELYRGVTEQSGFGISEATLRRDIDAWSPAVADYGKAGVYLPRDSAIVVLAKRISVSTNTNTEGA